MFILPDMRATPDRRVLAGRSRESDVSIEWSSADRATSMLVEWRKDNDDLALTDAEIAALAGAGEPDPNGAEQPLDIDPAAPREQAEHAAIAVIADWIGSDLAKGISPFDPGGIAGRR